MCMLDTSNIRLFEANFPPKGPMSWVIRSKTSIVFWNWAPPQNLFPCRRNVDGCNNLINSFTDSKTAICGNCKLYLNGKIEAFPPPPGTCLCCHESPNFSQSIFCSKCSQWLQESGEVDSDWGYWVRDKISGDIICIDYGPPINSWLKVQ